MNAAEVANHDEIADLIEREYDRADQFDKGTRPSGMALAETLFRDFVVTRRSALPTEDGYYLGFDKMTEAPILALVRDGVISLPDASKLGGIGDKLGNPERFLPFQRLVVAE